MCGFLTFYLCQNIWNYCHNLTFMTSSWQKFKRQKTSVTKWSCDVCIFIVTSLWQWILVSYRFMTLVYCHKILGLATWANATLDQKLTWQEKTSQNEFWPAKAHIAGSLFMGHKLFDWYCLAHYFIFIFWPIFLAHTILARPIFSANTIEPICFFSPHISSRTIFSACIF